MFLTAKFYSYAQSAFNRKVRKGLREERKASFKNEIKKVRKDYLKSLRTLRNSLRSLRLSYLMKMIFFDFKFGVFFPDFHFTRFTVEF